MKNVEIILFVYGNLLFGKVLYVKPELIERLYRNKIYKGRMYIMDSVAHPSINFNTLYIKGYKFSSDDVVMFYDYGDKKIALLHFEAFRELVKEVNESTKEALIGGR